MLKNFSLVIVACSFGFFFLGLVSYLISPDLLTADEIRSLAEDSVPEIPLPSKPSGNTILTPTTQKVCVEIPYFKGLQFKTRQSCIDEPGQPVETFVGPTSEEMKAWENEVARIQRERIASLEMEISNIENSQRITFTAYIKDVVQIGSGIFGMLFGAFGAFFLRTGRTDATLRQSRSVRAEVASPNSLLNKQVWIDECAKLWQRIPCGSLNYLANAKVRRGAIRVLPNH